MFLWQVTPVSDRVGPAAGVPAEVPRLGAAEVARDHQILRDASGPGEAAQLQAGLAPGCHCVLPALSSTSCSHHSPSGGPAPSDPSPAGAGYPTRAVTGGCSLPSERTLKSHIGPKISYWHIWDLISVIPVWRANWF